MNQPFYLIAGLGKTGRSISGYLQRRNIDFAVFDTRNQVDGLTEFNQEFPGVEVYLGNLPAAVYSGLTGIITSPGVPLDGPVFQDANRLNIPVIGDIECLVREIKEPIIAITGTNGKSTVTTLVGDMAKAAGLSVAVAGNIGTPVLDLLDDGQHYDLWVLELSSFQLDLTHTMSPVAASILNITADHLDRHHSYTAYIAAKQRVYQHANVIIHNRDDSQTYPIVDPQNLISSFGLDEGVAGNWGIITKNDSDYLANGGECLLSVDALRIKGRHNWQNALAACALAEAAGIDKKYMISVLKNFSGLPHRCQWVRTLDSVDWINDSKGTNIGATISAITGIGGSSGGKIVLIAGGLGKGADFTDLQVAVSDYVRSVVLIGADAGIIEQALSGVAPVLRASTLDDAVACARAEAKPGDVVLLSPACASQDMFRDFNHRGESYARLVGLL